MKTIYLDEQTVLTTPCVATIGFFDGVHKGHQYLIRNVTDEAARSNLEAMVITFDRHPRQVLQNDYIPTLLTTTEQKLQLLSETGIHEAVVLHFTREMAALSAQEFMSYILRDHLNVKKLMIGYDNRFGHNRSEGFDDYVRYGKALGMEVVLNEAFHEGEEDLELSSSLIRRLLQEGNIEMTRRCLGRPYTLVSHIVEGFKEGRKLGFPTANFDMNELTQLIPAMGVYAVKAQIEGTSRWYRGMASIGTRPTYNGTQLSIETNILEGFNENIYGKLLSVAFYKRLRDEERFENVEQLRQKMIEDAAEVNDYFLNIENYE